MKVAATIQPKDWMQEPGIEAIMGALGPNNAMLVGGAVRAALLNEPLSDIDIATVHTPDEVIKRMTAIGVKTIPTGIAHGTVTAVIGRQHYEITTLRQDVMTDGRHAEVAFSKDWIEDAKRRDFTINTLLMDLQGHVFDPTHQGLEDLQRGLVRFVGNPGRRINEDYLRILRFFRFHARYGKGRPDLEGVKASIRAADKILELSRERITQEFEKILPAKGAAEVLEQLHEYDILPGVISPDFDQGVYKFLQTLMEEAPEYTDKRLLFAYSVWRNEADSLFTTLEKVFVLSNALKSFLTKNIQYVAMQPLTLNQNLYHFGRDVTLSGHVLYSFLNNTHPSISKIKTALEIIAATPIPEMPVNGNDICQLMNMMPGKEAGDALRNVEKWWLNKDTRPGRDETLAYIRQQIEYPQPDPEPEIG